MSMYNGRNGQRTDQTELMDQTNRTDRMELMDRTDRMDRELESQNQNFIDTQTQKQYTLIQQQDHELVQLGRSIKYVYYFCFFFYSFDYTFVKSGLHFSSNCTVS